MPIMKQPPAAEQTVDSLLFTVAAVETATKQHYAKGPGSHGEQHIEHELAVFPCNNYPPPWCQNC